MLEKIKENLEKITFVLSIVAGALLVPTILSIISSTLNESVIVALVEYLLLLTACILMLMPKTDIKKMLPIANVIFYGALAFVNAYSAISGSIASYAISALYCAVAILVFIPTCKNAYKITSLIAIAFFLSSALGGGSSSLSILLISLLIAANYYFREESEKE